MDRKCIDRSQLRNHRLSYSISVLFFSSLQTLKPPATESSIAHLELSPSTAPWVLSYLARSGFSQAHIEKFASNFPSAKRQAVEPKIKVLLEAGFSSSEVANVVSNYPCALFPTTKASLESTIRAIRSILGSSETILKALRVCNCRSNRSLEDAVIPNIEYLKSLGVESSRIRSYFTKYPRIFYLKPESLVEKARRVEEMGFDMGSKLLMEAIRVVSSMTVENWEMKLNVFREVGYSEDQILSAFRRVPQVFCVSEQKIKDAVRLFVGERGVGLPYLVRRLELLTLSVDGRVNPRLQVIRTLVGKELVLKRPDMRTTVIMSQKNFVAKFVLPYSKELGDDLVALFMKVESRTNSE